MYCPWLFSLLIVHTSSWLPDQSDAYWMLHRHFKFNFSVATFTCFLPYLLLLRLPCLLSPYIYSLSMSYCSVAQSCLTLCDPVDCNTPGFYVHHHLPKFAQVHVHCISDAIQPSHPPTPSSPSTLNPSQDQRPLLWVGCSYQATKILECQPQSVLPVNIQGWFPLRLTGLLSLLSKGLSGVLSSTTAWRPQLFGTLPSVWSTSHNCMWPLGRPQPRLLGPFVGRAMSLLFNTLSRFVIAFLPRSKCPLILWLQSPSTDGEP